MLVLGIETSCDETGVAVYDSDRGLLAHTLYSQVKLHAEYGGVVPELASRDHVRKILPLLTKVLADAKVTKQQLDGIAYTAGPGLLGALMVGASVATALAYGLNIPAIGVHHIWKAIYWRRCWKIIHPLSLSLHYWFPVGIRNWSL